MDVNGEPAGVAKRRRLGPGDRADYSKEQDRDDDRRQSQDRRHAVHAAKVVRGSDIDIEPAQLTSRLAHGKRAKKGEDVLAKDGIDCGFELLSKALMVTGA